MGAVIVNRVEDKSFPNTVEEVIFEPRQFEPVRNGRFWRANLQEEDHRAARAAMDGRDSPDGATFFFAPAKTTDGSMWSQPVIMDRGNHRFAS